MFGLAEPTPSQAVAAWYEREPDEFVRLDADFVTLRGALDLLGDNGAFGLRPEEVGQIFEVLATTPNERVYYGLGQIAGPPSVEYRLACDLTSLRRQVRAFIVLRWLLLHFREGIRTGYADAEGAFQAFEPAAWGRQEKGLALSPHLWFARVASRPTGILGPRQLRYDTESRVVLVSVHGLREAISSLEPEDRVASGASAHSQIKAQRRLDAWIDSTARRKTAGSLGLRFFILRSYTSLCRDSNEPPGHIEFARAVNGASERFVAEVCESQRLVVCRDRHTDASVSPGTLTHWFREARSAVEEIFPKIDL